MLGGVVVLALLVTGGVFLLGNGGDDDGSDPQADKKSHGGSADVAKGFTADRKKLWNVSAKTKEDSDPESFDHTESLAGTWLLKDAVVRADGIDVAAYDLKSGKKKWSVQKPSTDAVPCGLTPTVNKKQQGGIVYKAGDRGPCKTLQVVDARTGKVQWKKDLMKDLHVDKDDKIGWSHEFNTMVNDSRMLAMTNEGVIAYDLSGKKKWTYTGSSDYCNMDGVGQGDSVAVEEDCVDTDPENSIRLLDAETGKKKWSRPIEGKHPQVTMLHTDPVVAQVKKGSDYDDHGDLITFDPKGKPYKKIPVDHKLGELKIPATSTDLSSPMFIKGTTMVTTVQSDPKEHTPNNVVVAFDLTKGKTLWNVPGTSDKQVKLLGLQGDYAIAITDGYSGNPPHLIRYALSNGKKSKGGEVPLRHNSLSSFDSVWLTGDKMITLPKYAAIYDSRVSAYGAK